MAQTEVLANITINASGVVSGIQQSNRSLDSGRASLSSFGAASKTVSGLTDTFVTKMFSMRSAISSVARVLGIAGLVLGLANALKTLVTDVISNTAWFKKFSESLTDWYNATVKGETAFERLTRKIKDQGIDSVTKYIASLRTLAERTVFLKQELTGTREPGLVKLLSQDLEATNKEAEDTIAKLKLMGLSIRDIQALIDKQDGSSPRGSLLGAVQGGPLSSTVGQDRRNAINDMKAQADFLQKIIGLESAKGAASGEATRIEEVVRVRKELNEELRKEAILRLNLEEEFVESRSLRTALEDVQSQSDAVIFLQNFDAAMSKTADSTERLNIALAQIREKGAAKEAFKILEIAAAKAAAKMDIMHSAAAAIGETFATAILAGGKGLKAAIQAMLQDLAKLYLVKAIENLALGIMASTPWGFAVLGEPAPYFAAAKLWGVAAAAAGAASAAVGAPPSGDTSSSGGSGGGQGGNNQRLTINVQGSMIGTNPDDLARSLARLLRTAQADGAA